VITLTGDRNSYELPVYGAKALAVRDAILDLHGMPGKRPWTRLSETVLAGNNTIHLVDPRAAKGCEIPNFKGISRPFSTCFG